MITARIEPIDRDIAVIVSEDLSDEARSAFLAEYAEEQIAAVRADNAQAIGQVPDYETIVDGRRGAPPAAVQPDGVVVAEYDLLLEVFAWIGMQLVAHSPRLSGRYVSSHAFFADGVEIASTGAVPDAYEYVFVNLQPYARKIERGLSSQAPDGVYQAVAAVAARRFGNIATIGFNYRAVISGRARRPSARGSARALAENRSEVRQPAIVVKIGR